MANDFGQIFEINICPFVFLLFGKNFSLSSLELSSSSSSKAPLFNEDKDNMEEGESEDDRAAYGVEPGMHWVQHVVKGWAGENGVIRFTKVWFLVFKLSCCHVMT